MIAWMVATVILDGLIIGANIVEMGLLISKWKRLDRIEHLLFSLCVADLTCGCSMFGQDVFQLNNFVKYGKVKITSDVALLLDSLIIFFILVSTFHVTAIAIERIVAVSMPLKYLVFTTYTCKVFTISFVWSTAVILAPTITLVNKYGNSKHVIGQLILAIFIATTCVILFISYMLLTWLLIRRQRELQSMLEPEMRNQKRELRTTLFCLFFGFTFLGCMLPYAIGLMNVSFFHSSQILLVTAYHLINPLIFFVKNSGGTTRTRRGTILNSASTLLTRSPNLTRPMTRAMTITSVGGQSAMQTLP